MKKYRKCEEIVEILKAMVGDRVRASCYYLPGEVAMSEEIGVSRITLRKAMTVLEQEGVIRRDRVRTEIVERRDILSNCGRILFVAGAHHSTFFFPAVERLWYKLSSGVTSRGGFIEFFGVDHTTTPELWKEKIANSDVIILTATGSSHPDAAEELLHEAEEKKHIFSLLEGVPAPNRIYLDNYITGTIAAQTLVKAACRRIVCISMDYNFYGDRIFARRVKGFSDELARHHMLRDDTIRLIPYPSTSRFNPDTGDNYSRSARVAAEEAWENGCDGLFVSTDEEIGPITMNLFRKKLVSDSLKLLTFNGSGCAMRHLPPISCLSHGTNGVVNSTLDQLKLIAAKRFNAPVNIAVKPELYKNHTLESLSMRTPVQNLITTPAL